MAKKLVAYFSASGTTKKTDKSRAKNRRIDIHAINTGKKE